MYLYTCTRVPELEDRFTGVQKVIDEFGKNVAHLRHRGLLWKVRCQARGRRRTGGGSIGTLPEPWKQKPRQQQDLELLDGPRYFSRCWDVREEGEVSGVEYLESSGCARQVLPPHLLLREN